MTVLLIVESPSKARTIQKYLGAGYAVRASVGHVRDLPAKKGEIPPALAHEPWARLGVHINQRFRPLYVVPPDKRAVVRELREHAARASRVLLATDDDREGEAIAWHLAQLLGLKDPERVVYREVTPEALRAAVARPRALDLPLVGAQETRRVLDRLVGFEVSPKLWNSVAGGLSAGRVQSAALRVLAEREHARMGFVAGAYFRVKATVASDGPFVATVTHVRDRPLATHASFDAQGRPDDAALHLRPDQAEALCAYLAKRAAHVTRVTREEHDAPPPAPFTTSTLQQDASTKLRFGAALTARVAQALYEKGWITYIRTDSVHLSDEGVARARQEARDRYGAPNVHPTPRRHATRAKNAQEAHEAIRPSGAAWRDPASGELSGDERRLYALIFARTLASQMLSARFERQRIELAAGVVRLEARGRRLVRPGFLLAYGAPDGAGEAGDEDDQNLPDVREGEAFALRGVRAERRETRPPARFSEAALTKALEKSGVGRPSTYAATLATVVARGYARLVKGTLVPTFTGLLVDAYLGEHFPELGVAFTARMEEDLDRVARGEDRRLAVLERHWTGVLARRVSGAPATAPVVRVPRAPDVRVTARGGAVTLVHADGRSAPVPPDLTPDELTEDLASALLDGRAPQPASKPSRAKRTARTRPGAAGAVKKEKEPTRQRPRRARKGP